MRYIVITVLFVAVLLLLPFFISFLFLRIADFEQPPFDQTQKIQGLVEVGQPFKAPVNNLSSIGVSLKNPQLQNKKDIHLEVLDIKGVVLRSVVVNGLHIPDGNLVRFDFEPIANSYQKEYLFILKSPTSTEEDAMEVFLTKSEFPQAGDLVISRQKLDQKVSFMTFHKPDFPIKTAFVLYASGWNKFWGDTAFFVSYVFVLVLFVIYLSKSFLKK